MEMEISHPVLGNSSSCTVFIRFKIAKHFHGPMLYSEAKALIYIALGAHFHYNKSLIRDTIVFRYALRMIIALAYLPVAEVEEEFFAIASCKAADSPSFNEFCAYFQSE